MLPKETLEKMANYADKLKDIRFEELALKDQYIRIGGLGYRSVSLNSKFPLCKYSERPIDDIDKLFNEFKGQPVPMAVEPARKPERCLQRYIIKASLINNRNMITALALKDCPYDELIFATDEVSLGDVRCDILAVGKVAENYYPVIIELKSSRNKKELIGQLCDFSKTVKTYNTEFSNLLSCITGKSINTNNPQKIIVWPVAESEANKGENVRFGSSFNAQKTRDEILSMTISLLEYDTFDNHKDHALFHQTWASFA